MSDTIHEINDRPIWWKDAQGFVHACEGADVHPGVRLFWTLCQRDVPANAAHHPNVGDKITCATCAHAETQRALTSTLRPGDGT